MFITYMYICQVVIILKIRWISLIWISTYINGDLERVYNIDEWRCAT